MNFGKGKSDILFSLVCIWAIIFFAAFFAVIGAAASHSEWALAHVGSEQSNERIYIESDDEAVEANGVGNEEGDDIFIRIEEADSKGEKDRRAMILSSVIAAASGVVTAAILKKRGSRQS